MYNLSASALQDGQLLRDVDLDKRIVGPHIDHVSQAKPGKRVNPNRLYVVTMVSNPQSYRSRWELYRQFEKHMNESGVKLLTVEVAHGDREFEVTETSDEWDLQLRSNWLQHIWLKERAIGLGVQHLTRLDPNWKYVAWIDADIQFSRTDWAQACLDALNDYFILQPFKYAYDLNEDHEIVQTHQSFGYSYATGQPFSQDGYHYNGGVKGAHWHPGYAWAARREFFDITGGLFDISVLGSGDDALAKAIVGRIEDAYPNGISQGFQRQFHLYQERCQKLYRNLGYIDGSILHRFHGQKVNRGYRSRWKYLEAGKEPGLGNYLVQNLLKFDPETDLIPDHQGLFRLPEEKYTLRDACREYFASRKEYMDWF